MSKALFVLTSHKELGTTGRQTGFYLSEAAYPYKLLTDAGHQVDFVSPQGGEPPVDGFKLDDPVNKAFWEDPQVQAKLKNTPTPDQVDPADYDAIFYAGGHGTMWDFADNERLAKVAADIYEAGGVVGAVCHGPSALVNIKLADGSHLVDGKTVASFTNEEENAVGLADVVPFLLESKLIERGAKHSKAPNFEAHVEVSERLVTGQNPASAEGVGRELAVLLQSEQVAAA